MDRSERFLASLTQEGRGAVKPRQHHSIAPIRFDPISGFDGDQRRRNHCAGVAEPS
jgi:hypothetical protein